jgi:hypothetical protein
MNRIIREAKPTDITDIMQVMEAAIMQHNISKHGFAYCGIIYLASGDERLAYQSPT